MENVNVTIRMDRNLKKQADQVFGELGMSFTTAVTLFTKQCVRDRKIPFEICLEPNQETIDALNELKAMMSENGGYKDYNSFAEILEELDSEIKNKKVKHI